MQRARAEDKDQLYAALLQKVNAALHLLHDLSS